MKRFILLLLGFTPFVLGRLLDWVITVGFPNTVFPFLLIGLVMLFVWFLFAFYFGRYAQTTMQAIVLLNLPALFVLVMLGIQELVLGYYWLNAVGLYTQLFYLPFFRTGIMLTSWSSSIFLAYCASFIVMLTVSFLGCKIYQRHYKTNERYF